MGVAFNKYHIYLGGGGNRQNLATCRNPEHVNSCAILGVHYPNKLATMCICSTIVIRKFLNQIGIEKEIPWAIHIASQILYMTCAKCGVVIP